jgi:hypothetical protein
MCSSIVIHSKLKKAESLVEYVIEYTWLYLICHGPNVYTALCRVHVWLGREYVRMVFLLYCEREKGRIAKQRKKAGKMRVSKLIHLIISIVPVIPSNTIHPSLF